MYVNPYMILSDQGITKHYYNGSQRVATQVSDPFLLPSGTIVEPDGAEYAELAQFLLQATMEMYEPDDEPIEGNNIIIDIEGNESNEVQPNCLDDWRVIDVDYYLVEDRIRHVLEEGEYAIATPIIDYYHTDHLGSASWITDNNGEPIQYIHYMPYGELWVNQRNSTFDERDNIGAKYIFASFGTRSNKLEMFKGSTVKLDAIVDCIFDSGMFYILQKHQFETLVGMAVDFHEEALSVVEELKRLDKIAGLEHLSEAIEKNTAIHKKLVRLKKLQNYMAMDNKMITQMKKAAKTEKYKLQLNEEGKIVIENSKDVDMVIKLLCDYYKQGVVTGKNYGTYAGKYFADAEA